MIALLVVFKEASVNGGDGSNNTYFFDGATGNQSLFFSHLIFCSYCFEIEFDLVPPEPCHYGGLGCFCDADGLCDSEFAICLSQVDQPGKYFF